VLLVLGGTGRGKVHGKAEEIGKRRPEGPSPDVIGIFRCVGVAESRKENRKCD